MGKHGASRSSGGICCIQVSLVVFNFITLLGGVATLGIGVWLFIDSQPETILQLQNGTVTESAEMLEEISSGDNILGSQEFRGTSILLIALGSLVTFVSFIGCFGAFVRSRCLLLLYFSVIGVILVLQLMLSAMIIVHRVPLKSSIRKELLQFIQTEYKPDGPLMSQSWDYIQSSLECCGVDSYQDWNDYQPWLGRGWVPDSCCNFANNSTGCGQLGDVSKLNRQGCLPKIQMKVMEQLHLFATAIITLVFLQLYGIIASTLLFYHVKSVSHTHKPQATSTPYKAYSYERAGFM